MCDADQAMQMEASNMSHLFGSSVNASLLNVFFLTDRVKKDRGVSDASIKAAEIGSTSVLGAGIMGSGIAAANIKRGIAVVLTDANAESLINGVTTTLEEAAYDRKTKSASSQKLLELTPQLRSTQNDEEIASSDLVIEAVVENIDVKRSVLQRLEPFMSDKSILASNTSTIPITQLADGLTRPEQFCGIHFFNPVRRMKLVEVIRGEQTSDVTTVTAVAYAKRIGKLPVVVNDGPGFLVNRLLFPYMNEAIELLQEGTAIHQIDRASKAFGMPMGPIELYDMVGIDTAVFAGGVMAEAFPDRMVKESPLLSAMVDAGRLGKKSGTGFFSYQNRKQKAQPDPSLDEVIAPFVTAGEPPSTEAITNRLFLPMLLEATRALEDNIVRDVRDVDFGLIYGVGFPPFKGGILHWADSVGAAAIVELIKPFAELGKRFEPTEMLKDLAKNNGKFYG